MPTPELADRRSGTRHDRAAIDHTAPGEAHADRQPDADSPFQDPDRCEEGTREREDSRSTVPAATQLGRADAHACYSCRPIPPAVPGSIERQWKHRERNKETARAGKLVIGLSYSLREEVACP